MIAQVFSHGAIYTLGALLSRGITFFLLPLYTYRLTQAEFALVDYLTVVGAFVAVTLALEVAQGITRYLPECLDDGTARRRLASTGLWFTFGVHLVLLVAVAVWQAEIGTLLFGDRAPDGPVLVWATAAWLSVGLVTYFRNLLRAELKPRQSTMVAIIHAAAVVILTAGLLYTGDTATAQEALIALTAGGAIAAGCGLALSRPSIALLFSGADLRRLLAFSGPLVFASVGAIAAQMIDRIMIVELLGLEALAPYAVAGRIALMVSLLLVGFQNALTPLIYAGLKNPDTPVQVARLFRWFVAISLVGIAGLVAVDQWIVALIAPAAYGAAADLTPLLVVATVLVAAQTFFPGLSIAEKTTLIAAINLSAAALNLALNLVLIPRFGLPGAAMATLISAFMALGVTFVFSQRYWAQPIRLVPVLMASLSACLLIGLGWYLAGSTIQTIGFGLAAILLTLLIVVIFGLIRRDELAHVRRRYLQ